MAQIEKTRAGLVKYCFRQLPSASADVQHMCGRETEDGKWGNTRKTDQKGKDWPNIASVSFRQPPRTPNTCVGGRQKMGPGEL